MTMLQRLTAGRSAALTVMFALAAPAAAFGQDFNPVNGQTFGDTPYTSAAPFSAATPFFDNSAYTIQDEERNFAPNHLACDDANPAAPPDWATWGSKTAWVRFVTGVAGRLRVRIDSDTHDVFFIVYTEPTTTPPGTAAITDLDQVDCYNGIRLAPDETPAFDYLIPANQTIYVKVLSVCSNSEPPAAPPQPGGTPQSPCDGTEETNAPGGLTSIGITFTPDNVDGDSVPDTLDPCPSTSGPVNGCPDTDGDGVADPSDACPNTFGRAADGCRLPDHDGDGYAINAADPRARDCNDDNAAINPAAGEIVGNDVDENCDGLVAFDRDGDGVIDLPGPDCNPNDRNIPGPDTPGNGVDEDCVAGDAPFPRVTSDIAPSYLRVRGRVVGFASFGILPVTRGMRIRIECRGRGCPFSARDYRARRSARQMIVGREFRRHLMQPGARVVVKIIRAGHVGRAVRFTLRSRRGRPRIERFCMRPETTRPLRRTC
jgi:hypothetical protein